MVLYFCFFVLNYVLVISLTNIVPCNASSQFRCLNGQCISASLRCNGVSGGCTDGSDELRCSEFTYM